MPPLSDLRRFPHIPNGKKTMTEVERFTRIE
jgi:hypothetical protein